MRALQLTAFGLDRLEFAEQPAPDVGPGEVLVQFCAASINYRDYQICTGEFAPNADLPLVPCSDGAGVVIATGPGVSGLKDHDLVCPLFFPHWQSGEASGNERAVSSGLEAPGTLRAWGIYRPDQLVRIPDSLSAAEAACLPCAGLTAWNTVHTVGGIRGAGQWVLVQGTGGVALFALQFAKALGAGVIIISGSDEKLARATELGADHAINYAKHPAWGEAVRELTGGRGVDCVVEIGGEGTLPQSVASLRRGGHIGIIGYLAGIGLGLNVFDLIERNANLSGISVGNREQFTEMTSFLSEHPFQSVIDRRYTFDEAPQALAAIAEGQHFGKLVVEI